ncbi:hypothetical protein JW835_01020 [bacterium]|nr:hypothetical protein [bacterium]
MAELSGYGDHSHERDESDSAAASDVTVSVKMSVRLLGTRETEKCFDSNQFRACDRNVSISACQGWRLLF